MAEKIKNRPLNYLSRSVLAGGKRLGSAAEPTAAQSRAQEERVHGGKIDSRWYVTLSPKKNS